MKRYKNNQKKSLEELKDKKYKVKLIKDRINSEEIKQTSIF